RAPIRAPFFAAAAGHLVGDRQSAAGRQSAATGRCSASTESDASRRFAASGAATTLPVQARDDDGAASPERDLSHACEARRGKAQARRRERSCARSSGSGSEAGPASSRAGRHRLPFARHHAVVERERRRTRPRPDAARPRQDERRPAHAHHDDRARHVEDLHRHHQSGPDHEQATRTRMIFRALLMVGLLAAPSVAAADALSEADAAYTRVDFAETERLAQAALAGADHDRGQMIRIYFLLGVSAAAEGKDEEAIDAFKHLLALDPATKVDRDLSPKLQGPMLEARGTPPAPLACDAVFDRAKGVLQLTIGDQLKLSREAVVRWRLSPGGAFTEVRRPSAPSVDVTIPGGAGAGRVEYSYSLVDDRRNRLFEKGSDAAPEVSQAAAGAR